MKEIPTSETAAGMVLGRDILDENGRTMLSAGTALTDSHCRVLARHAIETIVIMENAAEAGAREAKAAMDQAASEELDANTRERMERVEHMFRDVMGDALMKELFRLALDRAKRGDVRA